MPVFRSRVFLAQSGCLLPFLLIFNLFFGRIFFKPRLWLIIEALLFLIILATGYIAIRRVKVYSALHRKEVIDVQGEVIGDKKIRPHL